MFSISHVLVHIRHVTTWMHTGTQSDILKLPTDNIQYNEQIYVDYKLNN